MGGIREILIRLLIGMGGEGMREKKDLKIEVFLTQF